MSAYKEVFQKLSGLLQPRGDAPRELAEIRHDILDGVAAQIQELAANRFVFPFERIVIDLLPRTPSERAAMQSAWIDSGELDADIRSALRRKDCQFPKTLRVEINFKDPSDAPATDKKDKNLWLSFHKADVSTEVLIAAPITLTVTSGTAEPSSIAITGAIFHIGRQRDVFDKEGQLVRSNDLAFSEVQNGINETVGRTHAHLNRQSDGRYALANTRRTNKTPTAIIRNGRSIPVILLPEVLQPGDVIQLGQARISVS